MHNENWHRALDVQMDTQRWAVSPLGFGYLTFWFESFLTKYEKKYGLDLHHREEPAVLAAHVNTTLFRADTIFVTTDMEHVLMQAAHDLPEDVTFDDHVLISPMGFCLLEEPMYGISLQEKTLAIHAFAWELTRLAATEEFPDGGKIIMIYFFTDPSDEKDETNAEIQRIPGEPLPPLELNHIFPAMVGSHLPRWGMAEAQLVQSALKLFVAMQLLAQQRIGEPMQMRPPRAARRRALSWDHHNERYITLITLRRKSVKRDPDEYPKDIEWSHRWMVQGHWRRQWHPSTRTHEWTYIYEYVKGPEDKPLLIRERRVFNFRR